MNSQIVDIIERVSQEEGFTTETLTAPEILGNFTKLSVQNADRCVDGRRVVESYPDEPESGFSDNYTGAQFAGATLGILDSLRTVAKLGEDEARKELAEMYEVHGLTIGAHTDDHHGELTMKEELESTSGGCGNQKVKSEKKVAVADALDITSDLVKDRISWARTQGIVFPLTGSHSERLAVVNLLSDSTFNTQKAEEGQSAFNMDLSVAYERAGHLYDNLKKSDRIQDISKSEFQEVYTEVSFRDYLQTLSALGAAKTIYIRS